MCLKIAALLTALALAPALPAQTPVPPAAVAAVDQKALARDLANRLESQFVYPEQGKRYAAALRAHADQGAYDGLQGAALANKLSADLQAVAADAHLRVMFGDTGGPQIVIMRPPEGAAPPPGAQPGRPPVMVRMAPPPPMEHAGWIAPGIAFVRFNVFRSEPETARAAAEFMASHATAKTIIFDIRTHRGGGLGEMDAIFPWLFAKPTKLLAMATRKSVDEAHGSPVEHEPSLRVVPADPNFVTREHWVQPGADKRLQGAKVFVLTSGFTASAGEHFAGVLKNTGRATLVGATTRGANHFGGEQDLDGGFTVFLPVGRAYDPSTGKDWEGTGIAPNVEVPAEDALTRALTMAGVAPEQAAALSAERAPKMPMRVLRPGA